MVAVANPHRQVLDFLHSSEADASWTRGRLYRSTVKGYWGYCALGLYGRAVLGIQQADMHDESCATQLIIEGLKEIGPVLPDLAAVLLEQFPEAVDQFNTDAYPQSIVVHINDRRLASQEEMEQMLEKAAAKWDERL